MIRNNFETPRCKNCGVIHNSVCVFKIRKKVNCFERTHPACCVDKSNYCREMGATGDTTVTAQGNLDYDVTATVTNTHLFGASFFYVLP